MCESVTWGEWNTITTCCVSSPAERNRKASFFPFYKAIVLPYRRDHMCHGVNYVELNNTHKKQRVNFFCFNVSEKKLSFEFKSSDKKWVDFFQLPLLFLLKCVVNNPIIFSFETLMTFKRFQIHSFLIDRFFFLNSTFLSNIPILMYVQVTRIQFFIEAFNFTLVV